jgi:pimeloyl-ACP methyl ester carboxylesterase
MKNNLLLIMSVLFLASCETFRNIQRDLASVKPKNYIIVMHGLSGSPESFQGMLPSLEDHLGQINPNYDYIPLRFKYSSGAKGADIERFVSEFENYLVKEIPVLNQEDKISIIAHSQGGLVGYLWYLKALDGVDLKQRSYMERVNGFVTLGTPFWGSRTTFLLGKVLPSKAIKDFVYDKMRYGDQEVVDITSASEKIYNYFSKMASKNTVNVFYDPRMLNIMAVVPEMKGEEVPKNYFLKTFNDLKKKVVKVFDMRLNQGLRWESDQAVNVSSGRLGFYYFSDDIYEYMELGKRTNVLKDDFNYARYFKTDPKVIMVEGAHAKASGYDAGYAIASIPDECIQPDKCVSTTYVHILKHLANCEKPANALGTCRINAYNSIVQNLEVAKKSLSLETSEMIHKDMRTFSLGFDIELPKNFVPPLELLLDSNVTNYLQVNYVVGNDNKKHLLDVKKDGLIKNASQLNYEIRLGRRFEWGSRIVNYSATKNKLNIQITGNVSPINDKVKWDVTRDYPLQMVINIPGLKKRTLVIPVRPTYTTFLDLKLD